MAYDGATNWLSTTTPMAGWVARSCAAALMPSSVPVGGIRMSVTTTSGSVSSTRASSSSSVAHVPTTVRSPSASMSLDTASRRR